VGSQCNGPVNCEKNQEWDSCKKTCIDKQRIFHTYNAEIPICDTDYCKFRGTNGNRKGKPSGSTYTLDIDPGGEQTYNRMCTRRTPDELNDLLNELHNKKDKKISENNDKYINSYSILFG